MEHTDTLTPQRTGQPRAFLERALFLLALLALACAPTQLTLPRLPLSPSDLFLGLAALVWAARWCVARDTNNLPPLANWVLVGAVVLSAVSILGGAPEPGAKKEFVLDLAKLVLYVLVGVTVFRSTLTTPQRIRTAVIILLATTSLAVLLGVGQRALLTRQYQPDALKRTVFKHFTPSAYLTIETPIEVCSTFGSWNEKGFHASRTAYAGFLGLALPFALVLLVTERKRRGIVLWMSALFAGAAISVLAGYLAPALLLGLLVTGVVLGPCVGRYTALGLLLYLLLTLTAGGQNRTQILQEPYRLPISTTDARNPNLRYEGTRHLKKIWGEQWAAVNVLRGTSYVKNAGLFGVGAGLYQTNIQEGYGSMSMVSNQRLESDTQSGYLLMMVNTGILGLAALLALFGSYLGMAWRQARTQAASPWTAALLGAMVALVTMSLVSNPWVRGEAVLIAALLAIIGNHATLAPAARIEG